jgi:hypothetical protein
VKSSRRPRPPLDVQIRSSARMPACPSAPPVVTPRSASGIQSSTLRFSRRSDMYLSLARSAACFCIACLRPPSHSAPSRSNHRPPGMAARSSGRGQRAVAHLTPRDACLSAFELPISASVQSDLTIFRLSGWPWTHWTDHDLPCRRQPLSRLRISVHQQRAGEFRAWALSPFDLEGRDSVMLCESDRTRRTTRMWSGRARLAVPSARRPATTPATSAT